MEWFIRSVNPTIAGEIGALEALVSLSAERPNHAWSGRSVSASLVLQGARTRVAATARNDLLGFVLARRISDLLEIDLVGVRPDDRRRGIARALLASLLDAEAAAGLGEARLELAASNDAARALYAGLDFMVVGRRTRYYPDGDDALLLSRAFPEARSPSPP